MTHLSKMSPGQKGRVVGYTKDTPISRRLTELGLVPGREIRYMRSAPLRDPMQIQVGSSSLTLRHTEADLVTVEVEE
jgi:ferrous iron transport protein A